MTRCDDCQDLLLDHLYGLIDGPEADAVAAHMAECPACAAARDRAAREQQLFARAATSRFPEVRFDPPADPEPAAAPKPPLMLPAHVATPVVPAPPPPARTWPAVLGWAVAASLLLAVPAASLRQSRLDTAVAAAREAAASAAVSHASASRELAEAEARTPRPAAAPEDPAAVARRETDDALARLFEEGKQVARAERERKLSVQVTGPTAVQPGAPNDFTVVLHDRRPGGGSHLVEAQVRDGKDKVLFQQRIDDRKNDRHAVRLPADLWSKAGPDADLSLVIATVDGKTGQRTEMLDQFRLLGPVYTTQLATDRPLYRPGERLYFRSLTLDRTSFRPPDHEQVMRYELRDPAGRVVPGATLTGATEPVRDAAGKVEPVAGPDGRPVRGVGCGAFDLPADLPAGEYTLLATETRHPAGYRPAAPASRTVAVRPYPADKLVKTLGYGGASFAGGDTVAAWCEVRDGGGPVAGAAVDPLVTVDGKALRLPTVHTGADGRAAFRFTLPPEVAVGDARVRADVRAGGLSETVVRPIPVVGRAVRVEFFPEGGELVAGVPCRVYLRASTPLGRPMDVRGVVTDGREVVARVETFTDPAHPGANRGLGAFTFTPKANAAYRLKLDRPAGAFEPVLAGPPPTAPAALAGPAGVAASRTGFPLPAVRSDGVVMTIPDGVGVPGRTFTVKLWSVGTPRNLVVGAYTRGRPTDTQRVTVEPGKPAVIALAGGPDPRGGVTRVTVFEEPAEVAEGRGDLKPLAERLVYRRPGEELKLDGQLKAAAGPLAAGGEATLSVRAADEKGRPAAAVLYACVTDAAAAGGPDGARDRLLTTHFLLAGEVQKPDDLEHVDFLLTDAPRGAEALDLLLGTQGWRRFAEQSPAQFTHNRKVPDGDAARLVMLNGQSPTRIDALADREQRRVYETLWPQYEAARLKLERVEARPPAAGPVDVPVTPTAATDALRKATAERAALAARERAAAEELAVEAADARERAVVGAWLVGGCGVVLALVAVAFRGRRLPFAAGAGAACVLSVVLAFPPSESHTFSQAGTVAGPERPPAPTAAVPDRPMPEPTAKDEKTEQAPALVPPAPQPNPALTVQATPAPPGGPPKADAQLDRGVPAGGGLGGAGGRGTGTFGTSNVAAPVPPALTPVPAPAPAVAPTANDGHRMIPNAAEPEGRVESGVGGLPMARAASAPAPGAAFRPSFAPGRATVGSLATPTAPDAVGGFSAAERDKAGDYGWQLAKQRPADVLKALEGSKRYPLDFNRRNAAKAPLADAGSGVADRPATADCVAEPQKRLAERAARLRQPFDDLAPLPGAGAAARQLDAAAAALVRKAVPRVPPLVVREYAHLALPHNATTDPDGDVLSPDTVLWQPLLVLPGDGKADLRFRLNGDSATYQIIVAGHTLDGRVGAVHLTVPVVPDVPAATK